MIAYHTTTRGKTTRSNKALQLTRRRIEGGLDDPGVIHVRLAAERQCSTDHASKMEGYMIHRLVAVAVCALGVVAVQVSAGSVRG
jgi:hypothetical protein